MSSPLRLSPLRRSFVACLCVAACPVAAAAPARAGAVRLEDTGKTQRLESAPKENDRATFDAFPTRAVIRDVTRGDVVVTEGGLRLRLIGVDVPTADAAQRQGDYYGREAVDYLRRLLLGNEVEIAYDTQKMDAYGQNLVYLTAGRNDVNADMVRRGFGLAACFEPNTAGCGAFAQYQREAMRAGRGLWADDANDWPEPTSNPVTETAHVRAIVDGDTITLTDGRAVRYMAVDAAENEQLYDEGTPANIAYEANYALVADRDVILEYDLERKDPRGRTLAWVWVDKDGRRLLVNEELVRSGVAWVAVFPPNINHVGRLMRTQAEARRARVGVWAVAQ